MICYCWTTWKRRIPLHQRLSADLSQVHAIVGSNFGLFDPYLPGLATPSQHPLDFKSAERTKTEAAEDSEDEKEEKEVDKNKLENREGK